VDVRRWSDLPVEQLNPLLGRQMAHTASMTVGRIQLVQGCHVARHEHPHEQIANVVAGRLRFVVGGEEQIVEGVASVLIPGGVPHEVEALEDSVVIDVFAPAREDWIRGDDAYLRR
jgi:quercetin dioxygenase-like cupin family protein